MSGHLKTTVNLGGGLGMIDVSTIDMATHGIPGVTGMETCLFWNDGKEERSEVVANYGSWSDAEAGHIAWSNRTVLRDKIITDTLLMALNMRLDSIMASLTGTRFVTEADFGSEKWSK